MKSWARPSLAEYSDGPMDSSRLGQNLISAITSRKQQALNALEEARKSLLSGDSREVAQQKAIKIGGFSGEMRPNLVSMIC